jgi:hypothetical protein
MELTVGAITQGERISLEKSGWRTTTTTNLNDRDAYGNYIQQSLGEFTVAKEQYVKPRTGWFSDRSVCYLAAGRPVVTQDSGFGTYIHIPTGEGLFAYQTCDDALAAITAIASVYPRHSAVANEFAHEYFNGTKVVGDLMRHIGVM